MRQIPFEIPAHDGYPLYRDALWVEDDSVLSDDEIETMKQARGSSWKANVDYAVITPRVDPPPNDGGDTPSNKVDDKPPLIPPIH